jgi:hypothetical protein
LDGRLDSLKERSIGIDLLGRDVSYDPSSDAIVRVRANDVRKRLSSYYASAEATSEIQINLPIGAYIPNFLPGIPPRDRTETFSPATTIVESQAIASSVPPFSRVALMRPAFLALLLCVLLMRHRLEDRESYLRFWDRIFGGRDALQLSISPQDQIKLAATLYPIAWIAGRYGIDTAVEEHTEAENRSEHIALVHESFATPPDMARDERLRWIMTPQAGESHLTDRKNSDRTSKADTLSAALLTILPEDVAAVHIQGTDHEAIEKLIENLTSQKSFPDGAVDQLSNRHVLQILLLRDSSGQWQTQMFSGDR